MNERMAWWEYFVLVFVLLMGAYTAWGCPKGMSEWQNGCVVDLIPLGPEPVKPSDEKPPEDKMPSWQREGIKVIDAPTEEEENAEFMRKQAEKEAKK